jgi:CDP-diacylglycerol--glycerol-3-phosphate 3-phosphatidyltransferase
VRSGDARSRMGKVLAPLVSALSRAGVTADMVTIAGTLVAVVGAVVLIGNGYLFWGAFTVTLAVLLDLLDGALARASGGGSVFGAVLDSTGDRAADAAIFGSLIWWFSGRGNDRLLVLLALLCLVLGVLTSYIKARAEGVGLSADVGIVERLERLILVLTGTGLSGLGVPYALHVGLWLLLAGSAVTVVQRLVAVHREARGLRLQGEDAGPDGAAVPLEPAQQPPAPSP